MIKVHIEKPLYGGTTKIYVSEEVGSVFSMIELDKENPPYLKVTKLEDYAVCQPFLELPQSFAEDFLLAMSNALSGLNIKTENEHEHALEGKHIATEKHLEDMRKIVFKDYEK